jgi:hypothetical protein
MGKLLNAATIGKVDVVQTCLQIGSHVGEVDEVRKLRPSPLSNLLHLLEVLICDADYSDIK